jgi:glyceraldehyde 3-phosphate dehydrogenase
MKERDPAKLTWGDLGVDVVLESTGFFTERDKANLHIEKVARSACSSARRRRTRRDDLPRHQRRHLRSVETHHRLERQLHDELPRAAREGVKRQLRDRVGLHEHDPLLHERPAHPRSPARRPAPRARCRGEHRAIEHGRAKAIGEVVPELKGKLNGGAFRVPTPDGSVTDFAALLKGSATTEQVNAAFKAAAADPKYKGVLEYSEDPLVLQDIVGQPAFLHLRLEAVSRPRATSS